MRCTMTDERTGKPCRIPALGLIGGLAVCRYHAGDARRLWEKVRDELPENVRAAAERDTRERNA